MILIAILSTHSFDIVLCLFFLAHNSFFFLLMLFGFLRGSRLRVELIAILITAARYGRTVFPDRLQLEVFLLNPSSQHSSGLFARDFSCRRSDTVPPTVGCC